MVRCKVVAHISKLNTGPPRREENQIHPFANSMWPLPRRNMLSAPPFQLPKDAVVAVAAGIRVAALLLLQVGGAVADEGVQVPLGQQLGNRLGQWPKVW